MVKAIHMHPFGSQVPPQPQVEGTVQQRSTEPPLGVPRTSTRPTHPLTQKSGSYKQYPPSYYPQNHDINGPKHATAPRHRGSSHPDPAFSRAERPRYMVETTSRPPQPRGNSYGSKYVRSHRFAKVHVPPHPDHRRHDVFYRQHNYPHEKPCGEIDMRLPPSGNRHALDLPHVQFPSYKLPSKNSQRIHDGHYQPLQTIVPNKHSESKEMERTAPAEKPVFLRRSIQDNSSVPPKCMKSPVTLCFERMLGAANYLANNPTPDHVKKQLALNENMQSCSDTNKDDLRMNLMKRKSHDNVEDVNADHLLTNQHQPKRIRGLKPFFISDEEAEKLNELGEANPFVQLLNDEALYHQVILLMTLEADTKEAKKASEDDGPVSLVISEGFYWRDYPELEQILYDNMESYYNMSVTSRQSRLQQQFNNRMVASIREAAISHGYSFDPTLNDKRIRDRMRCFYKTHLQNAKKRLATMQKHPTSLLNQSQLRIWIAAAKEQALNFTEPQQLDDYVGTADS